MSYDFEEWPEVFFFSFFFEWAILDNCFFRLTHSDLGWGFMRHLNDTSTFIVWKLEIIAEFSLPKQDKFQNIILVYITQPWSKCPPFLWWLVCGYWEDLTLAQKTLAHDCPIYICSYSLAVRRKRLNPHTSRRLATTHQGSVCITYLINLYSKAKWNRTLDRHPMTSQGKWLPPFSVCSKRSMIITFSVFFFGDGGSLHCRFLMQLFLQSRHFWKGVRRS